MKESINIFWFRRDLRLDDNHALYRALKSGKPILPIFIFDTNILAKLKDKDDKRVNFIHQSLIKLKEKIQNKGSDLKTLHGTPLETWKQLIQKYNIHSVYTNEDYEPYAIKRDQAIAKLLEKNNINFYTYKDQVIFSKNDILKKDGTPYTVYTPYKRKWYESLESDSFTAFNTRRSLQNFYHVKTDKIIELNQLGFSRVDFKFPTARIKTNQLQDYDQTRDIPALNSTSHLGLHLRFGTVSIRKCASIAMNINKTWLDELIWREFFMQITFHFPHVEKAPFKGKYKKIKWRNNKTEFKKWCNGKTGYPLVDAGMRELNATGFMHNRVRMVTASFLVKHLLIDWRWGEKYFAQKLLDFDLAANNGNWQWVAGTGCDAAPYFRIFNPTTQIKRFDPEYKYIKKWVPEFGSKKYPMPIVEHKRAYNRALLAYKNI